jgi:hypothetical protein
MGTSRSADWLARALVFSGRPDPAWVVPSGAAGELLRVWSGLPASTRQPASPPPLGYRGIQLQAPDGRTWESFGGQVTLHDGPLTDTRDDGDRRFERLLLATAPASTLPQLPTD